MSFIKLSNINLKFKDKEIFRDFSLTIERGEKILITGKSGNGKSTLLEILMGFRNYDSGEFRLNGKSAEKLNYFEIRKLFSYVNQDVSLRQGIVKDVLNEIARFSGNDFNGTLDRELTELFDFHPSLINKNSTELSGGERQRLGIIIAIMLKRPVYLLDEVTSALDRELKEKVARYFNNCKETVIAVSHDNQWLEMENFRKEEW